MAARPLVPLAAAFGLGIAVEYALGLPQTDWLVASVSSLLVGVAAWWARARRLLHPVLLLVFTSLGGHAMAAALFGYPPHHLVRVPEGYLSSPVALEGWVVAPPEPRPAEGRDAHEFERTRFVAEVTRLRMGEAWFAATGRARLTVLGEPPVVAYGDEIRGTFRLRAPRRFENPGAFDYPLYLATQGISLEGWTREPLEVVKAFHGSSVLAWMLRLRELLLRRLDAALPAAESGLLKAMVLGDRSGLSQEMHRAFLNSGTYHILAISGLNVSLLAGTLFGLFRLLRVSPRLAALASALLVTLYAALAGASASVVRAAVMVDAYLLAVILDRRSDLMNSLALSALILLWWNPRFLFDVGFQLTFLATLGIVLVLPRAEAALASLPRPLRWAMESVVITLAATAMTLPILASAFNRVAPVGILANLPVVPLSGLITALGFMASVLLLAAPTGFPLLNHAMAWIVDLLFAIVQWFAAWPWSAVRVYTPTPGMIVAYYVFGAAWLLSLQPGTGKPAPAGLAAGIQTASEERTPGSRAGGRRWAHGLMALSGIALVVQVVLRLIPPEGPPQVRMRLLDIGQGEAIFLEFPGQRRMLVDTGGLPGTGFDVGSQVVAPFLWHEWVGDLDVLVLTHPEGDHIGGAPAILRNFRVGEVWSGSALGVSPTYLWVQEYLRHHKIPHRIVAADSPALRWGEASIEVIHPEPEWKGTPQFGANGPYRAPNRAPYRGNDASLVLRIGIGTQAALLTGDVEREGEAALLRRKASLRSQVLKVPHHGSRTSSAREFIAAVRPQMALVSAGYRNRFHHPHPEVVRRYQAMGVALFRTDLLGAITVEMTPAGTRVWGRRKGN